MAKSKKEEKVKITCNDDILKNILKKRMPGVKIVSGNSNEIKVNNCTVCNNLLDNIQSIHPTPFLDITLGVVEGQPGLLLESYYGKSQLVNFDVKDPDCDFTDTISFIERQKVFINNILNLQKAFPDFSIQEDQLINEGKIIYLAYENAVYLFGSEKFLGKFNIGDYTGMGEAFKTDKPVPITKELYCENNPFIYIVPGTYKMGSPPEDKDRFPDEVQKDIEILEGFWIAKYPTTQRQYVLISGGKNMSQVKGPNLPVTNVSWYMCQEFCQKITDLEILDKNLKADLPYEALWEYAARAGTQVSYYGTEWEENPHVNKLAWNSTNSKNKIHAVGLKEPNKWGLYDMLGDVWVWCKDIYET